MTFDKTRFERRGFLRGAGVAGLGLAGLTGTAAAKPGKGKGRGNGKPGKGKGRGNGRGNGGGEGNRGGGGKQPLLPINVDAKLYASFSENPDSNGDYGFPSTPIIELADPIGGGLFETSEIERTPNGGTLHHTLKFFQEYLLKEGEKPKPYVMTHEGDGRYKSHGQVMNFESTSQEKLKNVLNSLAQEFSTKGIYIDIVDSRPVFALTGQKLRGVGTDRVQLVSGDSREPEWGLTRVDFYSRGGGKPRFLLSLLYVIWADNDVETMSEMPDDAMSVTEGELIEPGRLNQGGQPRGR